MSKEFTKFDAAKAGREFASDESRAKVNMVLTLYLRKMISTQGPMALDAYLVTVISPLIDSVPIGEEKHLETLQKRIAEFMTIILDEERNMRATVTATGGENGFSN